MTGRGLRRKREALLEKAESGIDEEEEIQYEDSFMTEEKMISLGKSTITEVGRLIDNPKYVGFAGSRYLVFDIDLAPVFRSRGGQYDRWYLEGNAESTQTAFLKLNAGYTVAVYGRRRSLVAKDKETRRPRSFNFNEVIRIDVLSENQEGSATEWKQKVRNMDSINRHH